MGRRLKVFWWNKYPNLGDALTPLLLEHYGYDVERAEAHDADVCVIGSILETVGPQLLGPAFCRMDPRWPLLTRASCAFVVR
jgi:hypothetical protein